MIRWRLFVCRGKCHQWQIKQFFFLWSDEIIIYRLIQLDQCWWNMKIWFDSHTHTRKKQKLIWRRVCVCVLKYWTQNYQPTNQPTNANNQQGRDRFYFCFILFFFYLVFINFSVMSSFIVNDKCLKWGTKQRW